MDVVLIVVSVIFALLVIAASVYFLVYFQHPQDKWVAWLPKFVVVLGMSIACYNVFLLPLDVANQQGSYIAGGGLPMAQINVAFFIATALMVMIVVPFTVFYYEGEDSGEGTKAQVGQIVYALKWLVPVMLLEAALIGLTWFFIGTAEVPVTVLNGSLTQSNDYFAPNACYKNNVMQCSATRDVQNVTVSVFVYIVALTSLVGWFLFAVFGGVGLVALPWDLMLDWKYRPKPIHTDEYNSRKKVIGEKAQMMMEYSKGLDDEMQNFLKSGGSKLGKTYRQIKAKEDRFRKDVVVLEYHYDRMEEAYKMQGGNFILQVAKLIVGIVGMIISITWVIHSCIYVVPVQIGMYPFDPFLNTFFMSVSSVPFIGPALYALWAFWLLACVIKGTLKLGMRILFIPIHEMKFGATMMNSLIFNVGLILLSSLAVAQFCTIAFADYARYTASLSLFGIQIQNLTGISYLFKACIFIMLGFILITIVYMIYRPQYREFSIKRLKY